MLKAQMDVQVHGQSHLQGPALLEQQLSVQGPTNWHKI